jgi:hypothetical protein
LTPVGGRRYPGFSMTLGRWRRRTRDVAVQSRPASHFVAVDAADSTSRSHLPEPETGSPRFLYVVARSCPDLYLKMRRRFLDDDTIQVLLDRRTQDRRVKTGPVPVPERRRADRRHPTDYWESTAHHPAVLIPLRRRPDTDDIEPATTARPHPDPDKESTMEPAGVNAARVLAWIGEGRDILDHVLPAILDERDALQRELQEVVRRCHDLQAENEALRGEVARASAAHRQLEQGQAEIVGSVGEFVTQLTHVLEPMRTLTEKLGQSGYGRTGG